MAIFLSYAHEDSVIAEAVAQHLRRKNVHVWIDRWQINAGDSISKRIEGAIGGVSAILFFISQNYIKSKWCKHELETCVALQAKQLDIVIMPLLLDNSDIPREIDDIAGIEYIGDFNRFVNNIQNNLERFADLDLNRVRNAVFNTDYGIDYELIHGCLNIHIDAVDISASLEFSVYCGWTIVCTREISNKYRLSTLFGNEYEVVSEVINSIVEHTSQVDSRIRLIDSNAHVRRIEIQCIDGRLLAIVNVTARKIGKNNGFDIEFDYGGVIRNISDIRKSICASPMQSPS